MRFFSGNLYLALAWPSGQEVLYFSIVILLLFVIDLNLFPIIQFYLILLYGKLQKELKQLKVKLLRRRQVLDLSFIVSAVPTY